jgi:hypothetical protein
MKVKIEFDGVEEQDDVRTALDGYKWKLAMGDLDQELRRIVKYQNSIINHNQTASSEEMDTADKIREEIRNILEGYSLNLD